MMDSGKHSFATALAQLGRTLRLILFVTLGSMTIAACGESPQAERTPPLAKDSLVVTVVYQSGKQVKVRQRGGQPRVVLENARYPRLSPDAERVAAVSGREVVVVPVGGGPARVVAQGNAPRAVAWSDSGDRLFFTDGNRIQATDLKDGRTRTVWRGGEVLELDAGPGDRLVGTVKGFGYDIYLFGKEGEAPRKLASGCSASFSPDGRLVSNLLDGHRSMQLLPATPGAEGRTIKAPAGIKYDNHMWSNHPDWIAGELEGPRRDIVLINSRNGEVIRVTDDGDASRGDVYIHAR